MKKIREHMKNKYGVELQQSSNMEEFVNAYLKQKGATSVIVYKQEMGFINIDINSFCNLKCYSCNHFVDSAPSTEMMTLEQVREFVKESIELKWQWKELRITGGEPSLHPKFYEILEEITKLKKTYLPNITLKIISNGKGKKVREKLRMDEVELKSFNSVTQSFVLKGYPDWTVVSSLPLKDTMLEITLEDGEKAEFIPDFGNVFQAPIDRLEEIKQYYSKDSGIMPDIPDGYIPPRLNDKAIKYIIENNAILDCQVHSTCGFELTRYGYTPCPCGGGRVVGDDSIFFKNLADITEEKCYEILAKMCAMCGRNLNYNKFCKTTTEKTEFWKLVLENYKESNPSSNLTLYKENSLIQITER